MPSPVSHTINTFVLVATILFIDNVNAEQSQHELPTYIVDSKLPLSSSATANSQSIISREDLEIAKDIDINAQLYSTPSVMVAQSKSSGFSRINLRGASGGQGLITFDGVPLFANIAGLYSLRHFPREVVQDIHVERGFDQNVSNSRTLGGAIQINSRRVDDSNINFHIEGGSQATVNTNLAAGLGQGNENVSLVFGYTHIADGSTQSGVPSTIVDPDNYKMGRALLRADKSFERVNLQASVYYVNAQEETDGPGLTPDFKVSWLEDPNGWFSDEVLIAQAKAILDINHYWQSSLQIAYTQDLQDGALGTFRPVLPQGPFSMNLSSKLGLIDWQNQHALSIYNEILATIGWGLLTQYQKGKTTQDNLQDDQLLLSPNIVFGLSDNQWNLHFKGQLDSYSDYGNHLTYAIGGEWSLTPSVSLWANSGTRFRAPAVNELLHPLFGNPELVAEQSYGGELGFNWQIYNTRIEVSGYWQHFNNMISLALNSATGTQQAINISDVDTPGLDLNIHQQWLENWRSQVTYSYMHALNKQTGKQVPGRPEHRFSLINDWQIIQPLNFRIVLNMHSGLWHDVNNTLWSGSILRLNTVLNYHITENIQLYFRADNLTDEQNTEIHNFNYPQRSYYLGTELNF